MHDDHSNQLSLALPIMAYFTSSGACVYRSDTTQTEVRSDKCETSFPAWL